MAETIREMISEEKVDERIRELGRQISEDYAGKQIHLITTVKGAAYFYVSWLSGLTCRFLWILCVSEVTETERLRAELFV